MSTRSDTFWSICDQLSEHVVVPACVLSILAVLVCACSGAPYSVGEERGIAEATCWARGARYIESTSIGVVCDDGAVVTNLEQPKEKP